MSEVQRFEGARIDDLNLDALSTQLIGCLQRKQEHLRVGDDVDVAPFTLQIGHPERDGILTLLHLALRPIEQLRFNKDDRVLVADRALQQTLRIVRRGRRITFNPGT